MPTWIAPSPAPPERTKATGDVLRATVHERRRAARSYLGAHGKTPADADAKSAMSPNLTSKPMTLVAVPELDQAGRHIDTRTALHGLVRDDSRTRQAFLALTTRIDHAH